MNATTLTTSSAIAMARMIQRSVRDLGWFEDGLEVEVTRINASNYLINLQVEIKKDDSVTS